MYFHSKYEIKLLKQYNRKTEFNIQCRLNDGASKYVEQSTLLEPANNATALVLIFDFLYFIVTWSRRNQGGFNLTFPN